MRYLLTILLFSCQNLFATNYYVSNAGNDANAGSSTATSWQHLAKVKSFSFSPGDSILLNRGDSWNEQLIITSSGVSGSPIVVGAYGNGNKPLITGFQALSGFVNTSGNIWTATASNATATENTVLINGKIQAKARYPNANATNPYLIYQASGSQYSLISSVLTGTPNYTGVECVVRSSVYTTDVVRVSSQATNTLNFDRPLTYILNASSANGFFFQNDSTFLDQAGEWCMDSTTKRFQLYSTSAPTDVKISTIDTLIYLNHNSYITFDNLAIEGANIVAVQFDTLSHITVQSCAINNSGAFALSAQKSSYLVASNDSIQNSLSNAIYWKRYDPYTPMQDTCNYATVNGCYIKNTGALPGMGLSGDHRYWAVFVVGHQPKILNNIIDSSGYIPIGWYGDTALIYKNYITNFGFVKMDGGGMGTGTGAYVDTAYNNGSIMRKNIILNGLTASAGTVLDFPNPCLRLDNVTRNLTMDSNFLWNGHGGALYNNSGDSSVYTNNIIINDNTAAVVFAGSNTLITNGNTFKHNQVYSANNSTSLFSRTFGNTVGTCDSNYYSRPSNDFAGMSMYQKGDLRLSDWQAYTGHDLHSQQTPSGIALNIAPLIVYNPTNSDSTITFPGVKKSLDGVLYEGSITLHSFCGAILFTYPNYYKSSAYKHYQ